MKHWISHNFILNEERPLLPFLSLYYVHNSGVAFSLFHYLPGTALLTISALLSLTILWLYIKIPKDHLYQQWGFLIILSGAIGNLIDRARFHYVIDYIYFHVPPSFSFAIFNLADAFISLGAAFIILDEIRLLWKKKK
ncbi:signal peptidase II [Bartonella sp. DGB2]|uniref:signal peptidase II n=1 Tax=Bartonella sp. DGB2 TaxID=3388426 RepID=UPI003990103A